MRRTCSLIATAGLASSLLVLGGADPAAAAIVATADGTEIDVTMTGSGVLSFRCQGGTSLVSNVATTPPVACSALTRVNVTGDGGQQIVLGEGLDAAAFSADPNLAANLGAGDDQLFDTLQADVVTMGNGVDAITVGTQGVPNVLMDLGNEAAPTEFDRYAIIGQPTNDTITASTSGSVTTTFTAATTTGTRSFSATSAEVVSILGNGGNDVLSTAGVTGGSPVDTVILTGGPGNDTLTAGPIKAQLNGEGGTNVLNGSSFDDTFISRSSTDTINQGGSVGDTIYDEVSLRSGGRTISPLGASIFHITRLGGGDAVSRVRPGTSSGRAVITNSLTRPGQQELAGNVSTINVTLFRPSISEPLDRGLGDVHALQGKVVNITGDASVNDIADVTLPTSGFTSSGSAGSLLVIDPSAAGYGNVVVSSVGAVSIHGPWANANEGFAHRVTRDLVFRFPTVDARTLIAGQLAAGTRTRPQIVASLMDTVEYRALDVERVFVKYLRRAADPGGKAFWINSLDNGKALWRFRAQLFGSNEYFTKAGATNEAYVVRAYNDALGRDPDPSGRTFWTNRLNNGADRGSVALQFINSPEARRRLVDDQFLRFLDRLPTPTEQTTWVAQIPTADGELRLIAFLASSNAYFTRT